MTDEASSNAGRQYLGSLQGRVSSLVNVIGDRTTRSGGTAYYRCSLIAVAAIAPNYRIPPSDCPPAFDLTLAFEPAPPCKSWLPQPVEPRVKAKRSHVAGLRSRRRLTEIVGRSSLTNRRTCRGYIR